jgi:Flp pilus assembly protein TadD
MSNEETRLANAMGRADELLMQSLKVSDSRRRRRNLVLLALGGLIMLGLVLVLNTSLLFPTAGGADVGKAAALSAAGWQLWQKQDYDGAQDKFTQATKLSAKNVNAWNGLGWSEFNRGNTDEAKAAFEQVLKLEKNHPAANNGLGQVALLAGDYKNAEKYLLKAAPNAPAAHYGLARLYLLTGKFEDAAKWAKKAVAAGGGDGSAKEMLDAANAKSVSDDLRKKIEPPVSVKKSDDKSVSLGKIWQMMQHGERAEAKEILLEQLAKMPDDANLLNALGWCQFWAGDLDEAKPRFEKALAKDAQAAGAKNGLARILYAQGDAERAIKLWQEMVDADSSVHAGTYGLADAYLAKEEFAKALPLLEKIAAAAPGDADIQKKLDKATSAVKKP